MNDHGIGAGIVVGILISIGFGIYNFFSNRKQRKEQKEKESQYKKETQLRYESNDCKESLKNLKEKGIFTDLEYQDKVSKLENSEIQIEVERTEEYKQLKSLLNSDVLTKVEFESKLDFLKSKYKIPSKKDKEIDKDELTEVKFYGTWGIDGGQLILNKISFSIKWDNGNYLNGTWSYKINNSQLLLELREKDIMFTIIRFYKNKGFDYLNGKKKFTALKIN